MSELSRRTFLASTAGLVASTACSTPIQGRATTASPRFERERFVEDIKRALPGGQAAVEEVIARAVSQPSLVVRELGTPDKRSVVLLHRDADLSIFKIVWPPLAVVAPHDHLMWASIGVYAGREENTMWRRKNGTIEATTAASVGTKDVFSLPPDAIHSVTNPEESYTAAIHVYGGDLSGTKGSQWDPETLRKVTFDVEEGRRTSRQDDSRFAGPGV